MKTERVTVTISEEQTIQLGEKIGSSLKPGSVIALQGPLGSGKTTLVKGIARSLGISEAVTSPTFTIIQEYRGIMPLYHMDLYRIDSVEEFDLLGAEEYFYDLGVTVIEWSEKIASLLPASSICINCRIEPDQSRIITIGAAS